VILVVEVVEVIRSVCFQLGLGSFQMNTFVLLQLQESMAQRGVDKHEQWQGFLTILVVNHGIIKAISKLTTGIRLMITFEVDELWDCFREEVRWPLVIRFQLSTHSGLDIVTGVYTLK
jgi:hypothetical protein